jgi:hypothetical protein
MNETQPAAATEFQTQSPTISKIALALSKAQSKMTAAKRTATNPFFNSNYADLSSVWDAVRAPLAEHELAVVQMPVEDAQGTAIVTTLAHSSGEWFRGKLFITPKARDAQSVGSAITYARRYALSAITGIAPDDDDDGHKASHGPAQEKPKAPAPRPAVAPKAAQPSAPAAAAQPAQPAGPVEHVTFEVAQMVQSITDMVSKLNAGDAELMEAQFKTLTSWKDKEGNEKWLRLADLPGVGKHKPAWLKGIHKKIFEEYQKAFDAEGNRK